MERIFERPTQLPRHHLRIGTANVLRLSKRQGQRQLVFLPTAVLSLGLSTNERRALGAEAAGSAAAKRRPFWRRLAVRTIGLAGTSFLSPRLQNVGLEDFDEAAAVMEDRLQACLAHPPRPMAADLAGSAVARLLDAGDRARLAEVLDGEALPSSSMHGDLHLFNFVRARRGLRIIDWEHFDPDGSFVYDYLDFHVAIGRLNMQQPWSEALGRLDVAHPALRRAARASGAAPRALRAHYLLLKIGTLMARRGGPHAMPRPEREGLLEVLRRALAAFGIATCGTELPGVSLALAACCAV